MRPSSSGDWRYRRDRLRNDAVREFAGLQWPQARRGANVTVYIGSPTPTPVTNLVSSISSMIILGKATSTFPWGTWHTPVTTLNSRSSHRERQRPAHPAHHCSADPEVGFAAAPSTTIPSSQIQVQHAQGGPGHEPDRAREGEFRFAADGKRDAKQRASTWSSIWRTPRFWWSRSRRRGRHRLGGQFRRPGTAAGPGTSWRASCCDTPTAT